MLNLSPSDVAASPFPHAVKQGILPEDLYSELRRDFPQTRAFAQQSETSGSAGSRVGKGTGFDIYRGDAAYDALIQSSPAWKRFDAWINSPEFVRKFNELFGDRLDALGCKVIVDPEAYDRERVEGREVLTDSQTLADRAKSLGRKLFKHGDGGRKEAVRLFSRLDVEKSIGGYAKPPHCDRRNRLCSLIIYFTDLEAAGTTGGELNIYALKDEKAPQDHARHPHLDEVDVVATIVPKENLGVFFPCSNNSYHGVNALQSQDVERDFLYINISTDNFSAW